MDTSTLIPGTNLTLNFVLEQLAKAGDRCPIWQKLGDKVEHVEQKRITGSGFLSVITRLTFAFKNNNNNLSEKFSVVLKVPTMEILRQSILATSNSMLIAEISQLSAMLESYHTRELAFYTQIVPKYGLRHVPCIGELIPELYAWQDCRNTTNSSADLLEYPEDNADPEENCVCTNSAQLGNAFLLMENMSARGAEHRHGADDNDMGEAMVESVVKAMAYLHAHSLNIPKELLEHRFRPPRTVKSGSMDLNTMTKKLCAMPGSTGSYFRQNANALAKFLHSVQSDPEVERAMAEELDIEPVLCHGDLWVNNLLFDSANGQVRAILDWQFCHYGPGLSDLAHFLQNGVEPELRRRCTAKWLQLYRTTFENYAPGRAPHLARLQALHASLFRVHLHMEMGIEALLATEKEKDQQQQEAEPSRIRARMVAAFEDIRKEYE